MLNILAPVTISPKLFTSKSLAYLIQGEEFEQTKYYRLVPLVLIAPRLETSLYKSIEGSDINRDSPEGTAV